MSDGGWFVSAVTDSPTVTKPPACVRRVSRMSSLCLLWQCMFVSSVHCGMVRGVTFVTIAVATAATAVVVIGQVLAMRREFDSFDVDSSGNISADELEAAFVNLGFKFSQEQFVKIFQKVDADGSGFVDFQECVRCVVPVGGCLFAALCLC